MDDLQTNMRGALAYVGGELIKEVIMLFIISTSLYATAVRNPHLKKNMPKSLRRYKEQPQDGYKV